MESRPCVLVIDDDSFVLKSLNFLLRKYCDVTMATNGWEGISQAEQQDYDIAIVDIRMPGLSGIETLQQLKQVRPATEILMLTGGDYHQQPVKEAMKLGAADCILKPVHSEDLKISIAEAMRQRKAALHRLRSEL